MPAFGFRNMVAPKAATVGPGPVPDPTIWLPSSGAGSFNGNSLASDGAGTWLRVGTTPARTVYRSVDNGVTYAVATAVAGANETAYRINYGNGRWLMGQANGYVYKSDDAGSSWSGSGTKGLGSGSTTAIWRGLGSDGADVWVAGGTDGYASRTVNNGDTWVGLTRGLGQGSVTDDIYDLDTDGSGIWVATFQNGRASRSIDNGASWSSLLKGLNSGSTTSAFNGVATDGAGVWVVVGASGYCSRSIDDGATWAALTKGLNSGSVSTLFRSVTTDGYGNWAAVGNSGYASYSDDNGVTWAALTRGLNSGSATFAIYDAAFGNARFGTTHQAGYGAYTQ